MADTETIPAAKGSVIGDNQPPTPFDALKAHIDDLDLEARNHLDGEPIKTEAQASAVAKILDAARKASAAADIARKAEKKPHDDAAKEVQKKWTPLAGRADLIATSAKAAQTAWLIAQEDKKRAAVEAANEEAERLALAARTAAESVRPDDLAGQTTARVRQEAAAEAVKVAARLAKAPVHAAGGDRAIGLRSVWTASLSDPVAALKHYRETRPEPLKAWLVDQAQRDVTAGKRTIPGFTITEGRVAQ